MSSTSDCTLSLTATTGAFFDMVDAAPSTATACSSHWSMMFAIVSNCFVSKALFSVDDSRMTPETACCLAIMSFRRDAATSIRAASVEYFCSCCASRMQFAAWTSANSCRPSLIALATRARCARTFFLHRAASRSSCLPVNRRSNRWSSTDLPVTLPMDGAIPSTGGLVAAARCRAGPRPPEASTRLTTAARQVGMCATTVGVTSAMYLNGRRRCARSGVAS